VSEPIVYVDASAVAKLCLDEPESTAIERRVRGCRLISSTIVEVEVTRATSRVVPDDVCGPILSVVGLLAVDRAILLAAGRVPPPQLRTLDAIHLASALQLGSDLEAFVTYDRQLADAATGAGLPVESPR
jgi:hypothetical protein